MELDDACKEEWLQLLSAYNATLRQPSNREVIDRMAAFAERIASVGHQARVATFLGVALYNECLDKLAIDAVRWVTEHSDPGIQPNVRADAWSVIGAAERSLHRSDAARYAFEQCLVFGADDTSGIGISNTLYQLAQMHVEHGEFALAFGRAEELHQTSNEQMRKGMATSMWGGTLYRYHDVMAEIYSLMQDHDRALEHMSSGYDVACQIGRITDMIDCMDGMAFTMRRANRINEALQWSAKSLALAREHGDSVSLLNSIASEIETLLAAERNTEALELVTEFQTMTEEQPSMGSATYAMRLKATALARLLDPSAESYLHDALCMADEDDAFYQRMELSLELVRYYKARGLHEQALEYSEHSIALHALFTRAVTDGLRQDLAIKEAQRVQEITSSLQDEVIRSKAQLDHHQQEMTLTFEQLHTQSELLSHLRIELRTIIQQFTDPLNALKQIKARLSQIPCDQIEWGFFEAKFLAAHPEFRSTLLERYPDLTQQELKVCQLVRLGLKSAEIAHLLSLTERSVEKHRLNVRRKLGLTTEQHLAQVLLHIP